jgi:hypothetical protein
MPTPPRRLTPAARHRLEQIERRDTELDLGHALSAVLRGEELHGRAAVFGDCSLGELQTLGRILLGSSSAWTSVVSETFGKILVDMYEAEEPLVARLTKRVLLNDFRPSTLLSVDKFPALRLTPPGSEIRTGSVADGGEEVRLLTFASILAASATAFSNDDVGAITQVASEGAAAVVDAENGAFLSMLLANDGAGPTLRDDTAFFDETRGNIVSGALADTTLAEGIASLRKRRTPGGAPLSLASRFLLVGPDNEAKALGLVRDLTPDATAPRIEVLVSAALSTEWYVFADPRRRPAFVSGRLARRATGPEVDDVTRFIDDGYRWRVVTRIGVGAYDPRAAVRSPGV